MSSLCNERYFSCCSPAIAFSAIPANRIAVTRIAMHLTSPTEKVSIRALNQSDLELIVEIWTNPLTRKYLGGPVSVADASDRFAKMLKNNYNNSWFFVVE
jgi:hypothetical protein